MRASVLGKGESKEREDFSPGEAVNIPLEEICAASYRVHIAHIFIVRCGPVFHICVSAIAGDSDY